MEQVFIVHFKDHNSYIRKVVHVASTEKLAIAFCKKYAQDNPEYLLRRHATNKRVWVSEGFNHGLEIQLCPIDHKEPIT